MCSQHYNVVRFFVALVLVNSAFAQYNNNQLLKEVNHCPAEGVPVCASNGTDILLFPNECSLAEINIKNNFKSRWTKIALSRCLENCDLLCPMVKEPVCGLNIMNTVKRTFINRCEMTRDACLTKTDWIHLENGVCTETINMHVKIYPNLKASKKPEKPISCSDAFNPVCAVLSGVKSTFQNECHVRAENTKTGKKWDIFSEGICAEDYTSRYEKTLKNSSTLSIRSTKESNPFHFMYPEEQFGKDVTYIYTPPSFQTQFIQDDASLLSVFNMNNDKISPNYKDLEEALYKEFDIDPHNPVIPRNLVSPTLSETKKVENETPPFLPPNPNAKKTSGTLNTFVSQPVNVMQPYTTAVPGKFVAPTLSETKKFENESQPFLPPNPKTKKTSGTTKAFASQPVTVMQPYTPPIHRNFFEPALSETKKAETQHQSFLPTNSKIEKLSETLNMFTPQTVNSNLEKKTSLKVFLPPAKSVLASPPPTNIGPYIEDNKYSTRLSPINTPMRPLEPSQSFGHVQHFPAISAATQNKLPMHQLRHLQSIAPTQPITSIKYFPRPPLEPIELPQSRPYFTPPIKNNYYHRPMEIPYTNFEYRQPMGFSEKKLEFDFKAKECKHGNTPVCATFEGRTRSFDDLCELLEYKAYLRQDWMVLHDGKCNTCKSLDECTKEYRPICISRNGIKYTMFNECFLNSGMCQDQRSTWKIINKGECESTNREAILQKHESSAKDYSNYIPNTLQHVSLTSTNQIAITPASTTTTSTTTTTTMKPLTTTTSSVRPVISVRPTYPTKFRPAYSPKLVHAVKPSVPTLLSTTSKSTTTPKLPTITVKSTTVKPIYNKPRMPETLQMPQMIHYSPFNHPFIYKPMKFSTNTPNKKTTQGQISSSTPMSTAVPTTTTTKTTSTTSTTTTTTTAAPTTTTAHAELTSSSNTTAERTSIYGSQTDSFIMRIIKAKLKM